jgi:hypothetical protein
MIIHSNLYKPNPNITCELCVFGRGEHADWCEKRPHPPTHPSDLLTISYTYGDDVSEWMRNTSPYNKNT